MTTASTRLLSGDVHAEPIALGDDELPSGTSEMLARPELAVGLWDAGPGTGVDVEADEVFLVLSGRGAVTFEDGSVVELRPGVLVRLQAGDRTSWQVQERIRKLYVTGTPLAGG